MSATLAALSLGLAGLEKPVEGLGSPRSCVEAQLVDGELRCDEELLARCPDGPELEPGDVVELAGCRRARMDPEQLAALDQVVDIQSASAAELASLPGIGPKLAARIIAGRPYASVDELERVSGIGPKRLAALRPRARVGPEPPSRASQ